MAVKRTKSALPASPPKRKCVVEALAKSIGLQVNNQPATPTTAKYGALSDDTKQLVQDFYNYSDDISWQAPGRKDRIIVREV